MRSLLGFGLFMLLHGLTGASEAASSLLPCNGVPRAPLNRRACGFFVWDAPSALFYKWCHHLLKDSLIEGKGGHMVSSFPVCYPLPTFFSVNWSSDTTHVTQQYVRFESNSILQLLYPCSRYSPNECIVCGGSYPDHLELWWSKNLVRSTISLLFERLVEL